MKRKWDETTQYGEYYKYFVVLFTIGCIFILISLFFLPWIVIAPKKTATTFNLGMICILIAFGIQKGFKAFFIDQFFCGERPRNFFAVGFLISLVLCTYFAIFKDSFVGSLIFLLIEFALLIYFVSSYFPGGIQGVNYFFKTLCEGIKRGCTSCCKSD